MSQTNAPIITAFTADPDLTAALQAATGRLGYQLKQIATAADLQPLNDAQSERAVEPGENIFGREGRLLDLIVGWQPALILFDLDNDAVPWSAWLARLKSSPATRRRPVLAVAAAPSADLINSARQRGANRVVNRSDFLTNGDQLIADLAEASDQGAVAAACAEPLAPDAQEGIDAFNRGDYYEAHDGLEFAWKDDPGPGRDLYRALLQVAVALYQIKRGNYNGAMKMLLRVKQWFAPLPDQCRGVNVAQVQADAERAYAALIELGPEGMAAFDFTQIRPIEVIYP